MHEPEALITKEPENWNHKLPSLVRILNNTFVHTLVWFPGEIFRFCFKADNHYTMDHNHCINFSCLWNNPFQSNTTFLFPSNITRKNHAETNERWNILKSKTCSFRFQLRLQYAIRNNKYKQWYYFHKHLSPYSFFY